MGVFIYDSTVRIEFEDRLLAHIQLVITAKLRRSESFAFTWSKPAPETGQVTVWLNSQVPLLFDFDIEHMPPISREWLDRLTRSANSTAGLRITAELANPAHDPAPATASLDLAAAHR